MWAQWQGLSMGGIRWRKLEGEMKERVRLMVRDIEAGAHGPSFVWMKALEREGKKGRLYELWEQLGVTEKRRHRMFYMVAKAVLDELSDSS